MKLYEYVVVTQEHWDDDGNAIPQEVVSGPTLVFACEEQEVKDKVHFQGNDPEEVDVLVRSFRG